MGFGNEKINKGEKFKEIDRTWIKLYKLLRPSVNSNGKIRHPPYECGTIVYGEDFMLDDFDSINLSLILFLY